MKYYDKKDLMTAGVKISEPNTGLSDDSEYAEKIREKMGEQNNDNTRVKDNGYRRVWGGF